MISQRERRSVGASERRSVGASERRSVGASILGAGNFPAKVELKVQARAAGRRAGASGTSGGKIVSDALAIRTDDPAIQAGARATSPVAPGTGRDCRGREPDARTIGCDCRGIGPDSRTISPDYPGTSPDCRTRGVLARTRGLLVHGQAVADSEFAKIRSLSATRRSRRHEEVGTSPGESFIGGPAFQNRVSPPRHLDGHGLRSIGRRAHSAFLIPHSEFR